MIVGPTLRLAIWTSSNACGHFHGGTCLGEGSDWGRGRDQDWPSQHADWELRRSGGIGNIIGRHLGGRHYKYHTRTLTGTGKELAQSLFHRRWLPPGLVGSAS